MHKRMRTRLSRRTRLALILLGMRRRTRLPLKDNMSRRHLVPLLSFPLLVPLALLDVDLLPFPFPLTVRVLFPLPFPLLLLVLTITIPIPLT